MTQGCQIDGRVPDGGPAAGVAPVVRYRPDIDGLRALAVLAVVINHVDPALLPGGFLGVDVFFVISGFVVTGSLWDRRSPGFGAMLLGFWARRVRRLLPALLLCVLLVAGLGVLVLYPFAEESGTALLTGMAALVGASNLYLGAISTDYFAAAATLNPFLHTWSLGVEEQFYLVIPALLGLGGLGLADRRPARWRLLIGLGLLAAASFGLDRWLSAVDPLGAFFLMPARFWEMAAGCITFLAVVDGGLARLPRRLGRGRLLAVLLALATLLGLLWILYDPGADTLRARALTVLFSAFLVAGLGQQGLLGWLLSTRPALWIGLRSYGLYLWHWPVLVLARWTVGLHPAGLPLLVACMVLPAWASYRWVEQPLRRARWHATDLGTVARGGLVTWSGVAMLGLIWWPGLRQRLYLGKLPSGGSGAYRPPPAFPHQPFPPLVPGTSINRQTCFLRFEGQEGLALTGDDLRNCRVPPVAGGVGRTLFLMGDSYAAHLSPLVASLRRRHGFGLDVLVKPQCPFPPRGLEYGQGCGRFFQVRLQHLQALARPGDVLLIAESNRGQGGYTEPFLRELARLVRLMEARGVTTVMQSPLPKFPGSAPPECFYPLQWFQPGLAERCSAAQSVPEPQQRRRTAVMEAQLTELARRSGLVVWDAFTPLCTPPRCSTHRNGVRLYRDGGHLSAGAVEGLIPSFEALLARRGLLTPPGGQR